MEVDKNEWKTLKKAIDNWSSQGLISQEKAGELRKSLQLKRNDRQLIARYFFIIAISCFILAFGAIFIDDKILEKIKTYFSLSNIFIAVFTFAVAVFWFIYVTRKKHTLSEIAL